MPGERVEAGAPGHVPHLAQAVGEAPGEHLLDDGQRLIEIPGGRDRLGDLPAVPRILRVRGGAHQGTEKRGERIRVLPHERVGHAQRAARMAVPQVLREKMDEPGAFVDRALVERLGPQIPVDVARPQLGDHLRRGNDPDGNVPIGIQAVLGDVVAQQQVLHRVLEGNAESHPLPLRRIAVALVQSAQRDRLAVHVRQGGGAGQVGTGPDSEARGERHGRGHERGVVLAVEHEVADQRPSRRLHQHHLQALQSVEAHPVGDQQRSGARGRKKADPQLLPLQRAARFLREHLRGGEREERPDGAEQGTPTEAAQHPAPPDDGAGHRCFDDSIDQTLRRSHCLDPVAIRGPVRPPVLARKLCRVGATSSLDRSGRRRTCRENAVSALR